MGKMSAGSAAVGPGAGAGPGMGAGFGGVGGAGGIPSLGLAPLGLRLEGFEGTGLADEDGVGDAALTCPTLPGLSPGRAAPPAAS
jgi:hypothetical protein